MKTSILLPNRYKTLGWFILIPATLAGLVLCFSGFDSHWMQAKVFAIASDEFMGSGRYFSLISADITNTVTGALFIIGGMLVGFSKEKNEDEFITGLRLSSLLWAVCVSYLLLLVAFLFVYGTAFLQVMVYNMFTVLIIFIVRFNYILYRNSKTAPDEK
jgi:hypothetical protein